jgi:Protein of unknown function (DUF4031)
MTVFVDDWRQQAQVGRLQARWSHLFTGPDDQLDELHSFASSIGLRRSWFQDRLWPRAHYDVTEPKRQQAIAAGATEIPWREAGHKAIDAMRERRDRDGRPAARILAMGSRKWSDPATIRTALTGVAERHPGERLVLVHGMCDPRHAASGRLIRWAVAEHLSPADQMKLHGADWLADRIAREMGWEVEQHPADSDAHRRPHGGNPAGMIRNTDMVKLGAAEGVAFIQDRSPGATQAAALAKRHSIPVDLHEATTTAAPAVTRRHQPQQDQRPEQIPVTPAHRDGAGWVEPVYGLRSGARTCAGPHAGQGEWQASERAQDAGSGGCSDGHPLAAPLCEATAIRLAAAGITPDDPALTFIRAWNTTAQARQAEKTAAQDGEAEQEAGA